MKKINIGIIGCGHWGPNFVRNFKQIPDVVIWGVCDLNAKRLKNIKRLYPYLRTFTKYKKIINEQNVDAVVISTPATTHYKLAKEALEKDKHLLIEKPIALDIKEAEELIELANKKKRILMVGHTFIYNPAIQKIKKIIKNKELGKIYYLHSKRTNLGPLRQDVNAMWDLAPHDISIFSYLLEAIPKKVIAGGQDYLQKGKEDVVFATLTYPRNILANIHVSWLDPRKTREITIVGSKKMLVFDDLNSKEPVKIYDKRVVRERYAKDYKSFKEFQMLIRDGEVSIPKIKMAEPMKIECRHFIKCIRKNKIPLSDGNNGLDVLKILNAIQLSLDKKGEVCKIC